MAEEALSKIGEALEELALMVMDFSANDLPGAGKLLDQFNGVVEAAESLGQSGLIDSARVCVEGLEKLIMGELESDQDLADILPEVVGAMQETARLAGAGGENASFPADVLERLCNVCGIDLSGQDQAEEVEEAPRPCAIPDDLDVDLASSFVAESMELLQEIEVNILAVEQNPDDPDTINAIFRPFHTIKGVSGFLNLIDINRTAHDVENLLDEARSGNIVLEGAVVDLVLDAVDMLRVLIAAVSTVLQSGERSNEDFGVDAFIKRVRMVKDAALAGETSTDKPLGQVLMAEGVIDEETLNKGLEKQKQTGGALGETLIKDKAVAPKAVAKGLREQRAAPKHQAAAVRVDTSKLDSMVDMVGELVIALSLVAQNPKISNLRDQKLERDLGQLSRITSELQKTAMGLRMVPIKQTFDRMIRLIRDLAHKSGKSIELVTEGAETEIDRNMVDAIYDPLVHMIRNSCDHGLETPAEREASGKPPKGQVYLRAYHQGGRIVIEIEDDGRGLCSEKILAKARERGVIAEDADLSEQEIHNLIMRAGFSTAEKITDISGRGVGMDVVKEAVEKLRGNVEIASKEGAYTRFYVRLPLTMAIIEGMVVRVGGERFILPTLGIEEVLKPEESAFSTVSGGSGEMVMVRGSLLPLVRLGAVFGYTADQGEDDEGIVVVVESEGERKAIVVDQLLGKQEVVIKSLGAGLKDMKGLAGGAILGDGRVGLILDLAGLFQIAEQFIPPRPATKSMSRLDLVKPDQEATPEQAGLPDDDPAEQTDWLAPDVDQGDGEEALIEDF